MARRWRATASSGLRYGFPELSNLQSKPNRREAGVIMREFITLFLPIGAVLFLLAYFFLIHPESLSEFGYWLQKFF
jgi:hypothetical protein